MLVTHLELMLGIGKQICKKLDNLKTWNWTKGTKQVNMEVGEQLLRVYTKNRDNLMPHSILRWWFNSYQYGNKVRGNVETCDNIGGFVSKCW